jgi:hypothetical protein
MLMPDLEKIQSFNVTLWMGAKLDTFEALYKELKVCVLDWMQGRRKVSQHWVTGRFLLGTETMIHPDAPPDSQPEGGQHLLQFCGDIPYDPSIPPLDPYTLLETLTDLARCLCARLALSYARIRICTADLPDANVMVTPSHKAYTVLDGEPEEHTVK